MFYITVHARAGSIVLAPYLMDISKLMTCRGFQSVTYEKIEGAEVCRHFTGAHNFVFHKMRY